ncbi:ABC transporter permease [Caminicella sporogenes]|uniref:ABC transporter permease n=1 Tax=Caminicella sporogenes TaxID=166485 RepID=UPI0025412932|nr:ABC transporter permease [Caminicella sporogenes]WIF96085.1 ABC transporter permease [Caminicella sporogenes]
MKLIKRVIHDLKKYKEFIIYSIITELKVNLTETYLGYIWWLLDPLMYMLVYILVVSFIFQRGDKYFPIFVFSALLSWKWSSTAITTSTNSIKSRASILHQIYIPKFILPLIKNCVHAIYYIFGLVMLFLLLILFKVEITWHIIEFIFVFIANFIFLFALGSILAHLGVYFRDINNILAFTLRLIFYLSPGFYGLDMIPKKFRWIWWVNPFTTFYRSYRNVFLYGKSPLYLALFIWTLISLSILYLGLKNMYRYDKNYTKVI